MAELRARFEYRYRDAGNDKGEGCMLLRGAATAAHEAAIRSCLIDGEYFVAERIGIPTLYHLVRGDAEPDSTEDHEWHEFIRLSPGDDDGEPVMTVAELLERLRGVVGGGRW